MIIEKPYIGHSEEWVGRTPMLNFRSEWLRARFFPRKFTGGYQENQFLAPNLTPRMVRGAHEGIQNQVRIPNEGPKVLQVHPETLREHSWRRSGDQLGDLRNHEILSFLLRKCIVFQFLRFTASSAPGANNRHPQSDAGNTFCPPAPPPPEL